MKIKLISDFTDSYDHMLHDPEGEHIFRRVTTDGLDRPGILKYLQKLEFTVPFYGIVKQLAEKLKETDLIVVHHDLWAHRGRGKDLLSVKDALESYPEAFATQYIFFKIEDAPKGTKGLSWRYLQVGVESFWLQYTSDDDWRSNCGFNPQIKLFFRDKTELFSDHQYNDLLVFKYPLFAVDFVPVDEILYAVDFNIAPGITGTGVEKILKPREAANSIREAYKILLKEQK